MGHEEISSASPNTIFSTKGLMFACPDVVTVARRLLNPPPPPLKPFSVRISSRKEPFLLKEKKKGRISRLGWESNHQLDSSQTQKP